jgi:hypothetical protein
MKKVFKLKESELIKIIERVVKEQTDERYMFFSNLEQIQRQMGLLLDLNHDQVSEILENGHDWAQDHIATAKESIDQVFDFLMNETKSFHKMGDELGTAPKEDQLVMGEGKKKAGTKLCSRGKSAAKSKFKVYPSAYANGYAVQVCKGSMPGLDGKKRCSPPYC